MRTESLDGIKALAISDNYCIIVWLYIYMIIMWTQFILPLVVLAIIHAFTTVNAATTTFPIIYKQINEFSKIWDDSGSGADRDVSIWKPFEYQAGYYPLGDVAIAGHSKPTLATTVYEVTPGSLAPPASFEETWADHGSGADDDVKIMKMIPQAGFTCLGYVATNNYGSTPDVKDYRCVNTSYTIKGTYSVIWNDRGSGSDTDVTFFSNSKASTSKAVYTGGFTTFNNYDDPPTDGPDVLSSDFTIRIGLVQENITSSNYAIKVYALKQTSPKEIWNDKGSGASNDFAVYRPLGATPVGDIPVRSHSNPPEVTLTVKAIKDDALSAPVSFERIWNDAGSGADADVAFWKPICHPGYFALGHTAVDNHDTQPSPSDSTCVKSEYTEAGEWVWVWDDVSSGADDDVTVYICKAKNDSGQGLQAMGAVPSHDGGIDVPAYVLNSSVVQYIVGQPTTKYVLTNLDYSFDDRKTLSSDPEQLARTIVVNKGTTQQTVTRSLSYTYSETRDWSVEQSLEIGIELSVTAGVPDVASATTTITESVTTTHHTGESISKDYSDEIDAQITVQPNSSKTATVMSTRYIADVPYTATLEINYADGTSETLKNYRGIYRGAQVAEIRVELDADVPLS